MSTWKEQLPKRVPGYLQDENTPLHAYLEFCGTIFDEIADTIKEHDTYKDYRNSPSTRLAMIAKRMGFDSPATIPENIMREVIQDIGFLNKTRGTEDSIRWAFRLLGWEVNLRHAWLPEPERFDSRLVTSFSDLYNGDDLDESELSDAENAVTIKFSDGYQLGVKNQTYKQDPLYVIDGNWSIGVTELRYRDSLNQDFTPQIADRYYLKTSDIGKVDYRSFVYGEATATETGTYFVGGSWFTSIENIPPLRIIGERYNHPNALKYGVKVMSTPYIVVQVDNTDFDRFTVGDNQTRQEMYTTAEILFDYILEEYVRPANARILVIFGNYSVDNTVTVETNLNQTATHQPDEQTTTHKTESDLSDYEVGYWLVVDRDNNYLIGAPTYHAVNSMSGVSTSPEYFGGTLVENLTLGGSSLIGGESYGEYVKKYVTGNAEFTYTYHHDVDDFEQESIIEAPLVEEVYMGAAFSYVDGAPSIGDNFTEVLELRTPSTVTVTFPPGLVGTAVQIRTAPVSYDSASYLTPVATINDTITFELYDVKNIAFVSDQDITGLDVDVAWLDQTTASNDLTPGIRNVTPTSGMEGPDGFGIDTNLL